jgi:hypothetical protein
MKSTRLATTLRSTTNLLAAAAILSSLTFSAVAELPKSLLPAFGNDGTEFDTKSRDGNTVTGWLPKDWTDNTDWAPVTATYTKLTDSPDKDAGAVRIKIEKVEEGGQLQLTSYQGNNKYKKGAHYTISGWARSPGNQTFIVGARMMGEPYEFYHEGEITTSTEWKRFEFNFTPDMDLEAGIFFIVRDVSTVDLAGVVVEQKD